MAQISDVWRRRHEDSTRAEHATSLCDEMQGIRNVLDDLVCPHPVGTPIWERERPFVQVSLDELPAIDRPAARCSCAIADVDTDRPGVPALNRIDPGPIATPKVDHEIPAPKVPVDAGVEDRTLGIRRGDRGLHGGDPLRCEERIPSTASSNAWAQ